MKLHLTARIKRLGTIGPHTDYTNSGLKELELMLSKDKPAALINAYSLDFFKPYIENKTLVLVGSIPTDNIYVVTLPGEEERGKKILDLIKNGPPHPPQDDHLGVYDEKYYKYYHTELGRLLGYSEKDIEHFLSQ